MKKEGTHSFEGFVGACVLGVLLIITGFSVGAAGVLNGNTDNANAVAPVAEDHTKPVKLISKTFVQPEDKNHVLEVNATGEPGDLVKLVVKETSSGQVLWELNQKLVSESFAVKTGIMLKKGEYTFSYTPNVVVKLGVAGDADLKRSEEIQKFKQILSEYALKIKELESRGDELSDKEKEDLDRLRKKARQFKEQIMVRYKQQQAGEMSAEAREKMTDEEKLKRMEMKLKQITVLISELEKKAGTLTEEESEKLVKLRKSRDAIAAVIKK